MAFPSPFGFIHLGESDGTKLLRANSETVSVEDLAQELSVYLGVAVNVLAVLNSTSDDDALAVSQGKLLQDQITAINAILTSDDTTLDELQEIVSYIKQNKSDLQNLSIANIAGLADALANRLQLTGGSNQLINSLVGIIGTEQLAAVIAAKGIYLGSSDDNANAKKISLVTALNAPGLIDFQTEGFVWRGRIAYYPGSHAFAFFCNGIQIATLNASGVFQVDKFKGSGLEITKVIRDYDTSITYAAGDFVNVDGHIFKARIANQNQPPYTSSYDDAGTLRSTWINISLLQGRWVDYYNPATDSFSKYPLGIARLVAEYPLSRKRDWTFEISANGTFSNNGFSAVVETGDLITWDAVREQWGYPHTSYGKTDLKGSVSGSVDLDWLKYTAYTMDLADNTTLADVNLPPAGANAVRTIYINAGVADKTLTVPAYWTKDINSADFDSSVDNRIVVECVSGGTSDQIVRYNISNLT